MNSTSLNPLQELTQQLARFAEKRDWQQFHSPKNLSMALIAEAAELVEIFQWLTEDKSQNLDAEQWQAARMELADIFIFLLRISDRLGVDLIEAAKEKIAINEKRYPADKVKGSAKRATEYSHKTQHSLRDPVTGLLEYPVFRLTLEPQLARCRRYDAELCIIRLALEFNDKPDNIDFHAQHLRSITHIIKQNLRWADQVGRSSNGQFLIALPETSTVDASLIVDKLNLHISELSYVKTSTYGISTWQAGDTDQSLTDRTALAIQEARKQNELYHTL